MSPARGRFAIRSTPLKLTGILLTVFLLASTISFSTAYLVIRANYEKTLRDTLAQAVDSYRAMTDDTDLRERLAQDVTTSRSESQLLQYVPDDGARIANVASMPEVPAFTVLREDRIDGSDGALSDSYLATSVRLPSGTLTIADSREHVVEMGEIFVLALLMGLLPTTVLSALAGWLFAARARRRIGTIQRTLVDLTGGQLSARVPDADADLEDLSRISLAVNRMAATQEALIASMRQVTTDIAHDLRTPIQHVALILEEITLKTALSDGQEALLTRARTETAGIVSTFQSLLQLAQLESGAVRDRFAPIDLEAVARDVVEFMEAGGEETAHLVGIAVEGPGPFTVRGARDLLAQLLANLIGNGLMHVPAGGRITVRLSRQAGSVQLCVADDGPGIPEAERKAVLRRHYRLEQSRTTKGNGLGLSIVAAICDLHGADLTLEDNAPGLRVRMLFPPDASDGDSGTS